MPSQAANEVRTTARDGRPGGRRVPADRVQRAERAAPGPGRDPGAGRGGHRPDRLPAGEGRADAAHPALAPDRRRHPDARRGAGEVLDAFLHALTEQAQQRGYRILLFTAGGRRREIACLRRAAERVRPRRVRGHQHAHRRQPDRLAAAASGCRSSPSAGRGAPPRRHSWVDVDGACGIAGRHRAPDRRRPPADRVPRLAGRLGRRRRPPVRLGGGLPGRGAARPPGWTARLEDGLGSGRAACAALLGPPPADRLRLRQRHDRARRVDRAHRPRPGPRPGRRRDRVRRLGRRGGRSG